jgi:hypothetical protein
MVETGEELHRVKRELPEALIQVEQVAVLAPLQQRTQLCTE